MEVEEKDLEREGELIWSTPLDEIPFLPYLKEDIIPWTKGPPIIPSDHFTAFGKRILKIVEDDLLFKWSMDRTALYAVLDEHAYPRDLDTQSGRANLVYKLATDPLELKWAASWLIYKRMGGLMDLRETEEFECKIDENLPKNFQELQEIAEDKRYSFTTGQISVKRRVAEISHDQNLLIKWIGMNNKAIQAMTAEMVTFNKKLNYLKLKVEPIQEIKKDIRGGNKNIIKIAECGKKDRVPLESKDTSGLTKEVDTLRTKLETVSTKLSELSGKTLALLRKDEVRTKKNLARKFYQLRHRTHKPPKPLKTVKESVIPEDDEDPHEQEDRLNRSY